MKEKTSFKDLIIDNPVSRRLFSRATATSNACMLTRTIDKDQDSFLSRLKRKIKKTTFGFRMVNTYRAIIIGFKGLAKGKKGSMDHIKSTVSFMLGSNHIFGRPMNITIEPTNICNLQCPVCETGDGTLDRKKANMTMDEFKIIIDKVAPYANTIMYYFMGEPFLNKESYDMIKYAKGKGVPFITTCTNGDFVNPEKLVDCGIDEVSFQIGGMTQKTHETYRINSNIERVLKNLRETIRIRDEKKSKLRIQCGFILMKHNEHEVETFYDTMGKLNIDEAIVVDPCVRNYEQGIQYLPTDKTHWYYDPEAFKQGKVVPRFYPPNDCPWIYYSFGVHVDGNVVPCCRDPHGRFAMGNLYKQTLDEIWNGEKYKNFRKLLHSDQGKIAICKLCSAYPPSPIK